MSEKLKPCPFCGSKGSLEKNLYNSSDDLTWYAGCWNCDIWFTDKNIAYAKGDKSKAIKAWNRRADDDSDKM